MADTQTITQTGEIPEFLEKYYVGSGKPGETGYVPGIIDLGLQSILPKDPTTGQYLLGQGAYQQQYSPLIQAGLIGAGSVAPMSEMQRMVGQNLATMGTPGQFQEGTTAAGMAGDVFAGLAGLQAAGVTAPTLGSAQLFTGDIAKQYMSPYITDVVDIAKRRAIEDAERANLGQNLAAARQGTYGGARQALLQGQRESGLRSTLSDLDIKGLQDAYTQAQQQFERDRAATMGREQYVAGQDLTAQQLNQAAGLQAAQQRQQALTGLGGLASTFGGLGTTEQAADLDRLKVTGAYGDLERGVAQQAMDAQRAALVQQAEFGQTQLGNLSNLLRGIPLSSSTQTTTTPPASFASQLAGLGLAGVGVYNMLNPTK